MTFLSALLSELFPRRFGPIPPTEEAVEARLGKMTESFREYPKIAPETSPATLRCGFCLKRSDDVEKLLAGFGCLICDECVRSGAKQLEDTQ